MAVNHWFRWYHGTTTDPKFRTIARKAECPLTAVIGVWAFLLEQASQSDERGSIAGVEPEDIAEALALDISICVRILKAMSDKVLDDEDKTIRSWEKRQPKREDETAADRKQAQRDRAERGRPLTGAERVRLHRERKRNAVTQDVTKCNERNVTRNDDVTLQRYRERYAGADKPLTFNDKMPVTNVTQCHAIGEERREENIKPIPPTPLPAEPKPKTPSAVEVGLECLHIVGHDATPWQMGSKSFSQVNGWLGSGYTAEEITDVFRANKDRLSGKDNPLAYAAKILPDAIEARRVAAKASEERATNPADWREINGRPMSGWRAMRDAWRKDGFWAPHWGPAPDQPGTLCPVRALDEENENG